MSAVGVTVRVAVTGGHPFHAAGHDYTFDEQKCLRGWGVAGARFTYRAPEKALPTLTEMTTLNQARELLDSIFRTIDTTTGLPAGTVQSYAICTALVCATLLGLNVAAGHAAMRIRCSVRSTDTRINNHHRKAAELAHRYVPGSPTARSDLATAADRPEGTGRLQFARAQKQQKQLEWDRLRRWARRDVDAERYRAKFAMMRVQVLGSKPALVLALAIVLWVRPSTELSDWITARWHDMWTLLDGGTVARVLPAVMIVIGLAVVCSHSALDNMRARDEATKDANKLLAELLARLITARRATADWRQVLDSARFRLTDEFVRRLTDNRYSAVITGGIAPLRPSLYARPTMLGDPAKIWEQEAAHVVGAFAEVAEVCERIRQAGLGTVCDRLTAAERPAFILLGVFDERGRRDEERPLRAAPAPHRVRARMERIPDVAQYQQLDPDDPEDHARFSRWVEDQTFEFQKDLENRVAELGALDRNLVVAIRLLNRRLHTSRALAALGKS
ncbi:hypothetical protein [Nocardia camponoti]|uniref:Uncharacterized protein n=1 Tax=Nocardia camponoti TaxID=1616106 RepID=A0A917QQF2_9NOCA|nr:hypothetical protein [Nocardia camponoti]GGK63051.1 hypothetical protein GCM10011591_39150 [Nocardia camponoti]